MSFVNLHAHSSYSYLDSCLHIKDYVEKIKSLGQNACALTEHGHISSAMEFYKECKKQDIKPIIGVEFYCTEDSSKKERKSFHLVALAMNNKGWENIIKLIGYANIPLKEGGGFYYKPRIDLPTLFKHKEGVIVLTACISGLIPYNMVHNIEKAEQLTKKFKKEFGDRFYLEIQQVNRDGINYIPEQNTVIDISRKFSKKYNIPTVATADTHYLNKEDHTSHEILKAIFSRKTLNDPIQSENHPGGRAKFSGYDYYVQSEKEMLTRFDKKEVEESQRIADRCNVDIKFKPASKIPRYNNMDDEAAYELLLKIARRKTIKKNIFAKNDNKYVERIKKELSDVKEASLSHYFLIVNDLCEYADNNNIARGPGRGSAGGSLLSYILGITKTDPIKYNLIWERFYNKGRKGSYPDIDLDFDVQKRDKIIEYLRNKFGKNKVYPMMTIGTMAGKAALKDVGRAIGLPFDYINKITKNFPHKANTIKNAIEKSKTIKEFSEGIDNDIKKWETELSKTTNDFKSQQLRRLISERKRQLKMLFRHAKTLEGCKRQSGGHACAMIVSDINIHGNVPLLLDTKNKRHVTGYDMYTLEDLGFLKLDILGIKSVTVIDMIRKELKKNKIKHDKKESETYDDAKIFEMISRGKTKGIFQLESYLGIDWAKRIKPSDIQEWADVIALIRPATLETGLSQEYVDNKNAGTIEYIHPDLEQIFEKTQGIMLYQESLLEVARKIAGFSLIEADKLRKACGKKLPKLMAQYKDKFINGCIENKYDKELAEKLWEMVEAGASYSFNASHSLAYAMMGYTMAWYKFYYPVYFYLAMLKMAHQEQKPQEEIAELYYDAIKMGVDIKPPDINKSEFDFSIKNNIIYFGFKDIKGMGKSIKKPISVLKNVKNSHHLKHLIKQYKVTQNIIKTLIFSGAFDESLMKNYKYRTELWREIAIYYMLTEKRLEKIDIIMENENLDFISAVKKWREEKGEKLRNETLKNLIEYKIMSPKDEIYKIAEKEEELLGIPMVYCKTDKYKKDRDSLSEAKITGEPVVVCISDFMHSKSKNGNFFSMFNIYDNSDKIKAMYFFEEENVHKKLNVIYEKYKIWAVCGKMSRSDSFIINKIYIPYEKRFIKIFDGKGFHKNLLNKNSELYDILNS